MSAVLVLHNYVKAILNGAMSSSAEGPCSGFEPQNYLRDRCKKCFRLKSKHEPAPIAAAASAAPSTAATGASAAPTSKVAVTTTQPLPSSATSAIANTSANASDNTASSTPSTSSTASTSEAPQTEPPAASSSDPQPSSSPPAGGTNVPVAILPPANHKKERRRSWRDMRERNNDEGPDNEATSDTTDSISVTSFKTANSKGGLSSAKSAESVASNFDTRSMVTAASGGSQDFLEDERAQTPTEASELHDRELTNLYSEVSKLREENAKLREERQRWTVRNSGKSDAENDKSLIDILEERLQDAETLLQEYRDENTVLKCELNEVQESLPNGGHQSAQTVEEKLRAAESLCDELMVENEQLKADVKDLQTEIEEMQDQYREEEIDEFRELQRELEQNAKNCRVLQFKLRKSERLREQHQTERDHALSQLRALQAKHGKDDDSASVTSSEKATNESSRVLELESELRIAKEVSVRLHNELEAAEDKRYKLEDEIFYYKEKVRELQTQNKWREARNKADQVAKRQSLELSEASLSSDDLTKELRDVLEREQDVREQLRFTEEDLKRTQARLHELENENEELLHKLTRMSDVGGRTGVLASKQRPPMVRSASEGNSNGAKLAGDAEPPTESKVQALERRNAALTKKLLELEIEAAKRLQGKETDDKEGGFRLNEEMEKDLSRFMTTIQELERKNSELQLKVKRGSEASETTTLPSRDKALSVELRKEQERRKELETELADYKQLMTKSENQKLIAMATKVEIISNQLNAANDRIYALHNKAVKELNGEASYAESLKRRCDELEKEVSEWKAKNTFGQAKNGEDKNLPSADEIEQCCVVLASVEAQTNRICKQMEKMDVGQKEERRRSLSKDNGAAIAADLVSVMTELKVIRQVLDIQKQANPNYVRKSPMKELLSPNGNCKQCQEREDSIESQKQEIAFYKKKNKELTNQVLQTEDRWSVEIEKQTHGLRTQIRMLEGEVSELKGRVNEQTQLVDSKMAALSEKERLLEEQSDRLAKLNIDLAEKQRLVQDLEKENRNAKEWEIKYKKLESLYNKEKEKYDAEKAKIKAETAMLKKRTDEAVAELDRLRDGHQRREIMWNEERSRLEKEIARSREHATQNGDQNGYDNIDARTIPIKVINSRSEPMSSVPELRHKIGVLEKKVETLESKLFEVRLAKEDAEADLGKAKHCWEREKELLTHKLRQEEKLRSVEMDALQQKFTSRMGIMENTNKSLHAQLAQVRRERDYHRELVATYERKRDEEQRQTESERKKLALLTTKVQSSDKKIAELSAQVEQLSTELLLAKDAHIADRKLWTIERERLNRRSSEANSAKASDDVERDRRIADEALNAAEAVQKQYAEYEKFYSKEVARLNRKIKDLSSEMGTKETEFQRKAKELAEQIKVLEIDQKNLIQAKEMQLNAREILQADQERLMTIVHEAEMLKLTRKYKLSAIIEQLNSLPDAPQDERYVLSNVISQLNSIKEEDSQAAFTSSDLSEMEPAHSDAVSQSSMSIRSTPHGGPMTNGFARYGQHSLIMPTQRSFSIESSTTWDSRLLDYTGRSVSPVKKTTAYPEPPPNFLINKDKVIEYDKEGRLHYVPKSVARSASYDRYGEGGSGLGVSMKSTGTLTEDSDFDEAVSPHGRNNSVGTNILYKIRREELAKGAQPTVKSLARAFESLDPGEKGGTLRNFKRGLFSIRKSRSVDTNDGSKDGKFLSPPRPGTLARNTTSMSRIEGDLDTLPTVPPLPMNPPPSTLPRGGRNPFKNMGSKLVDRVRRSLSRSNREKSEETEGMQSSTMSASRIGAEKPPAKASTVIRTKAKIKKPEPLKSTRKTVVDAV